MHTWIISVPLNFEGDGTLTNLLDFTFIFFQVRGGIYRQNSLVFSETVRKLESIYIYPEYNDRNILHDIALAKLDRPFDMDTFTASVCMPPKLNLFADKSEIGKKLFFPVKSLMFSMTHGGLTKKIARVFYSENLTAPLTWTLLRPQSACHQNSTFSQIRKK